MNIRYDGPSPSVNVEPYGSHAKGEVKEYPAEFGEELIATSKKQRFTAIAGQVDPGAMTIAQLTSDLALFYDEDVYKKMKKAELVELWTLTKDAFEEDALAQE